jgi:hypothetical protein
MKKILGAFTVLVTVLGLGTSAVAASRAAHKARHTQRTCTAKQRRRHARNCRRVHRPRTHVRRATKPAAAAKKAPVRKPVATKTTQTASAPVAVAASTFVADKRRRPTTLPPPPPAPTPTPTPTPTSPPASTLTVTPVDAYDLSLSWPATTGGVTTEVAVNGTQVDQYASDPSNSYVVHELWPSTSYAVSVTELSASGGTVATYTGTTSTPAPSGAFPRLFAPSSWINTPISATPTLDGNSAGDVASAITPYTTSANLANSGDWGVPIVSADSDSTNYNVTCLYYGCGFSVPSVRIPSSAQPSTGSDGHIVVLQPNSAELDMWVASKSGATWSAGSRWVSSTNGSGANCTTQGGCSGGNASNLALAAGVVRPEEIAQGHIDHALALTTPDTRKGYIACPATHTDGTHVDPNALPLGAHVQLDPSINVAALNVPSWEKVIATALQTYGAYVVDTGGSLSIYGESNLGRGYDAWAKAGVSSASPKLSNLPWNSLRVLSMTQCGT